MRSTVIDLLQPGPQPCVEIVQAVNESLVEFAQELVAAGAVPALQFAFAFRGIGSAMDEGRPGIMKNSPFLL
jgi:hypothetical protein